MVLQALKGKPFEEVVKPGDTGDDMVMPPDPGYYGNPPAYLLAGDVVQMPMSSAQKYHALSGQAGNMLRRLEGLKTPTDDPKVIPIQPQGK